MNNHSMRSLVISPLGLCVMLIALLPGCFETGEHLNRPSRRLVESVIVGVEITENDDFRVQVRLTNRSSAPIVISWSHAEAPLLCDFFHLPNGDPFPFSPESIIHSDTFGHADGAAEFRVLQPGTVDELHIDLPILSDDGRTFIVIGKMLYRFDKDAKYEVSVGIESDEFSIARVLESSIVDSRTGGAYSREDLANDAEEFELVFSIEESARFQFGLGDLAMNR